MGLLMQLLSYGLGLGSLVCFILVLIKMFQNDQTVLGIVCIVTSVLCCVGALIAFVVGWMNSDNWRIQQVMLIWTGCIVGGILLNILMMALGIITFGIPAQGMGQM